LELGSGENLRDAERLKAEVRGQKSEVRAGFHKKDAKDAKSPRKSRKTDILKLRCDSPSASILYICG
jgi:hypothetical protein